MSAQADPRIAAELTPEEETASREGFAIRLTEAERDRRWPNLRPKDAATLIIVDRAARTPRILMGKRHPGLKFMPGMYVFPGGRIEPGDRVMRVAGSLDPVCEERLLKRVSRPSLMRARALALAAIRETFEETGLMIGSSDYGRPERSPPGPWSAFQESGVFPDLDGMRFIARAITPPKRPKRFDTRFFAVDRRSVVREVPDMVGPDSELVELAWVTLAQAKALALPTITRVIVEELEIRMAGGFKPFQPVPFYYEQRGRFVREEL